MMPGEQTKLAE